MKIVIIIVCSFAFLASGAFAQEEEVVDKFLDDVESIAQIYDEEGTVYAAPAIAYTFEIGTEYTSFYYEEPPINIEEEADLYGLHAAVTGRSTVNALMGRIEGRLAAGRVDYDGSLSNGTLWTDKGDDYVAEFRALLGRDFKRNDSVITPFFGVGYRYLNDKLESQYAYEREISYFYSPIGFETTTPLWRGWTLGLRAEYDIFWSGVVKSHFSDVNVNYNDLRNEQHDGYGARGSVYIKKKINENFSLSIEPFFRYWDIDNSDLSLVTFAGYVVGVGREPANRTKEYGLRISLSW